MNHAKAHILITSKADVVRYISDDEGDTSNAFRRGYGLDESFSAVIIDDDNPCGYVAWLVVIGKETRFATFSESKARGYAKTWNRLRSGLSEPRAKVRKRWMFVAAPEVSPRALPPVSKRGIRRRNGSQKSVAGSADP